MGQFSKYDALIECCERLDALGIVGWCMDDNGHENNHWSGTLAAMREHLGRQLTDEEITCLSLSRAFGPTPCVSDDDTQSLWGVLWPEGNPRGLRYDWGELAHRLLWLVKG